MSKSKKSAKETSDPFLELFGEDVFYQLLADAPDKRPAESDLCEFACNPLVEVDCQMRFREHGIASDHESARAIVFWVDDALRCIKAKGVNYRWSLFKDFDGEFTCRPDTPIGAILREMHTVHEFMAWKPYLERIRAIAAPMVKTGIAQLQT